MTEAPRAVSVVVPAHNESESIRRLLDQLTGPNDRSGATDSTEIIVVCNGCIDDTAEVARGYGGAVRVIEMEQSSKALAMVTGDAIARFPYRAYVDADVVVSRTALDELLQALEGTVCVVAPARHLSMDDAGFGVCWYYDVWQRLPQVDAGVFGRGVVVLSPEGNVRVRGLPRVMSDDLAASETFRPDERRVLNGVQVRIEVPRRLADLIRRRIRIATGNAQLDQLGLRTEAARTTFADLAKIGMSGPAMPLKVSFFLAITAVARLAASRQIRHGDFTTWLSDRSSRAS